MRLLLDTHSYLWIATEPEELSFLAASLIEDRDNQISVSLVSAWEVAIKAKIGKLDLRRTISELFTDDLVQFGIKLLPIRLEHIIAVSELELRHRDPFDRLLVAQAIAEDMPIVSCDTMLDCYPVTRLW